MPNILIESLGVYLPQREVSSKEVIESCRQVIRYPLGRLTGITSRRVAGENEFSIDLARKAVSSCMNRSKYLPKDIDLIICCNISHYDKSGSVTYEPSTAVRLKRDFGFEKAMCFDISNACAGMFTAIHIVDAFIKSGMTKRALVVSGEYITHLTKTAQEEITDNKEDPRLACLTLGDSGAAVILEESYDQRVGLHDIEMFTLGKYSDLCVAHPTTRDHGGCIMNTNSDKLLQIGLRESAKLIARRLKARENPYLIDHFLMHQISRPALDLTVKDINECGGMALVNSHQVINNLKVRGNTSSTTHFVALWDKIHDGTIKSHDAVLFAIQASGITLGVAPYTFDDLPDRIRKNNGRVKNNGHAKLNGGVMADAPTHNEVRIAMRALSTTIHTGDAPTDSVALATSAVESCLREGGCAPNHVGLLVNAGVYRNNFIGEPAIATIIAGENQLNATVNDWPAATTFAFDLCNGASGFLQVCRVIQAMIGSGKTKKALCVSSEIDNNRSCAPSKIMGLKEAGCAALIEQSNAKGFIRFLFKHYPEFQDALQSEMCVENGQPFLQISRAKNLEMYFLQHLPNVIDELLKIERLIMDDIKVIIPPQISRGFVSTFTAQLKLPPSKVVNLNDDHNYYTCSSVFGLKHALDNKMVEDGDLGIILEAGSGLQIAAALYQF